MMSSCVDIFICLRISIQSPCTGLDNNYRRTLVFASPETKDEVGRRKGHPVPATRFPPRPVGMEGGDET